MKKINNFFRGITILCFLISMSSYAQNDDCSGATNVALNSTVSGSTSGATFDGVGTCGTSNTAPGVWYKFEGDGGVITVSTCDQAQYDTKISVFSGECNTLTCVGGNDDGSGCGSFSSEFSFASTQGTLYQVLIHGFGSATGDFDLTVSSTGPPSGDSNDLCEDAYEITCGETVTGSTIGATLDGVPFCGTSNTAPGVWYRLDGDGVLVNAYTCNQADYDTKISVFSGDDCTDLTCVDGNDDGSGCSGFSSDLNFFAEDGETYWILVHGFGTATGTFDLTLECTALATNDTPETAMEINCGDLIETNNFFMTSDGDPANSCGAIGSPGYRGVWFLYEGDGSTVALVTTDTTTSYDTQIEVFAGEAGDFSNSVACDDDGGGGLTSTTTFDTHDGLSYYIMVTSWSSSSEGGEFGLSLTCALTAKTYSDCETVYDGYAPESCVEVGVDAAYGLTIDGETNYTYSWSDGTSEVATTASFIACPTEDTVYTVTVDDGESTIEASTEVVVVDVSCGNNGDKVEVCHKSSSPTKPYKTICIAASAVDAHLANHGDSLGSCESTFTCETPPACDVTITEPAMGATEVGKNTMISWSDASAGYVTGYEITIGTTPGGTDVADGVDVGYVSSYDPGTLANLTTYYVWVAPYNDAGVSERACLVSSFTTADQSCDGVVSITFDRFASETDWFLYDSDNNIVSSGSGSFGDNETTVDTMVDMCDGCYTFEITDSFGDGICCGFGNGSYTVTDGYGTEQASGGSFGSIESTDFCVTNPNARLANQDFSVKPNPTRDGNITLDLSDYANQDLDIQVVDFMGKVIQREEILNLSKPTHSMNLNNAVNGMYFVRVQTDRGVAVKKLIIAY